MKKIILVPIEPLDARYSIQWLEWFTQAIDGDNRFILMVVDPKPLTKSIETGAFLDVVGTNYYKAAQIQELCQMIYSGIIKDEDTILLLDGWFPGVEALAYIRDGLKRKFKIASCFHAGTYDPTDFISTMGMGKWGEDLENCWFQIYDAIFVATNYHKELICQNRKIKSDKIHVTGFPLHFDHGFTNSKKEKIVVFPHRLTDDKQPDLFDDLAKQLSKEYPEWSFVKTQEVRRSKEEYYALLAKCSIAVSFALHENWGIGMQEALLSGCLPVVPDRLSYIEMYPGEFRYISFEEAVVITRQFMKALDDEDKIQKQFYSHILKMWGDTVTKLYASGTEAIPNMLEIIHAK